MSDNENKPELECYGDKLALIAAALADNGLAPEGDYDIAGVTVTALCGFKSTIDQIKAIGEKLADAGLVTDVGDGLSAIDFIIGKYRELEAERDTLRNALNEQERKAADAELKEAKKARAVPVEKRSGLRRIAPIALKKGEKPLERDALIELIAAADSVEIAFSDGKHEIAALPARAILGDAWVLAVNGVKLQVPEFSVWGPPRGEAAVELDGYGLLLDGELVAYAKRTDALSLRPGGQYDLKDDVIFA